jgi:hypothetical protein
VYHLTPAGEEFARGCLVNLMRTRRRLARIFRLYREQFPEEPA